MEIGMRNEQLPIELECFLLKWGILPREHRTSKPDVVWPEKESAHAHAVRTGTSMGWLPSVAGQEPPF